MKVAGKKSFALSAHMGYPKKRTIGDIEVIRQDDSRLIGFVLSLLKP
jgi:hypothetical protein